MLVGTKVIDPNKFNKIKSVEQLERFSLSLVPEVIRHIPSIVDNQKYLVALYFRKYSELKYARKKEILDKFTENLSIKGSLSSLVSFEDILFESNVDLLMKEVMRHI